MFYAELANTFIQFVVSATVFTRWRACQYFLLSDSWLYISRLFLLLQIFSFYLNSLLVQNCIWIFFADHQYLNLTQKL